MDLQYIPQNLVSVNTSHNDIHIRLYTAQTYQNRTAGMQKIGGAEKLCDVEREQAEESFWALPTISQPIPMTLYSQDSSALYVKDVTSLKDQQNRPLMTLIRTLAAAEETQQQEEERKSISLLMFLFP